MKKIKYTIGGVLLGSILIFSSCATAQQKASKETTLTQHDVSMFPEAKLGQKRIIINVPHKTNESNFKIEIFAGKNTKVDCNHQSLMGQINKVNLDGWGYNYYEFTTKGEIVSTMMGCPENQPLKEQFVSAPTMMATYNSKLPYVIYVPSEYDVKYKVWTSSELQDAK